MASKSVLTQGKTNEILTSQFSKNNIDFNVFFVKGEPEIQVIDNGVEQAITEKANTILSIGGGSVLDTGKAISGLVTNGGKTKDFMEVIGIGKKITKQPLPHIAVPTTAGTGTEVTKNAVILSREDKLKSSIRSPLLIPKVAIIDPELTVSLPKEITASCGLDALTQLIESYTSNKAQPITDSLALLGIEKAISSLIRAFDEGDDRESREDMAFAALLSGICLANAGLGAVHGFAGPIGGMFNIPHGIVCGALLAPVLEQNISGLISQVPYPYKLSKFVKLGEMVAEQPFETVHEAILNIVGFAKNITKILQIPKPVSYTHLTLPTN